MTDDLERSRQAKVPAQTRAASTCVIVGGGPVAGPLTRQGRVAVIPALQLESHPNVLVVGDLAAYNDLPMFDRANRFVTGRATTLFGESE